MPILFTHRHILRATIEFQTPFLVAAGRDNDFADAVFVADANGLPMIPGTSLAGVLRSAMKAYVQDPLQIQRIFGYQQGSDGQGSRLNVSCALIHDAKNKPVEGLQTQIGNDEVLATAQNPLIRDHVRIHHRGAADAASHGKFDEMAVCAGHRFTFELEMVSDGQAQAMQDWETLLQVLRLPYLRIGGKTRRGFGAFKFVRLQQRTFDLRRDFDDYQRHPVELSKPSVVLEELTFQLEKMPFKHIEVRMKPKGYWMIGGGADREDQTGNADMAPFRDMRIVWEQDQGKVQRDIAVIPAASIKGALAHRTAFHYNAMVGNFIEISDDPNKLYEYTGENNPAVQQLFGFSKNESDGRKGRVVIDDIYLAKEPPQQLVHHVGIDRFTGGARDQVLFSERPFWKGETISLHIYILDSDFDAIVLQSFERSLEDLVQGNLQIGSGFGRGNGFFAGTWEEIQ